jgi:hypothetical protein
MCESTVDENGASKQTHPALRNKIFANVAHGVRPPFVAACIRWKTDAADHGAAGEAEHHARGDQAVDRCRGFAIAVDIERAIARAKRSAFKACNAEIATSSHQSNLSVGLNRNSKPAGISGTREEELIATGASKNACVEAAAVVQSGDVTLPRSSGVVIIGIRTCPEDPNVVSRVPAVVRRCTVMRPVPLLATTMSSSGCIVTSLAVLVSVVELTVKKPSPANEVSSVPLASKRITWMLVFELGVPSSTEPTRTIFPSAAIATLLARLVTAAKSMFGRTIAMPSLLKLVSSVPVAV